MRQKKAQATTQGTKVGVMGRPSASPSEPEAAVGSKRMSYRDFASFGKRQEFVTIAELLRRGFDVYLTLVDDRQIDCVIRQEVNGEPVYLDVQIKARSLQADNRSAGTFGPLKVINPRKNFFFIFYSEHVNSYWIMPSLELVKEANRYKAGANKGLYKIVFTNCSQKTGEVRPRPRFERYRNRFELLQNYRG